LINALEVARELDLKFFTPSSIGSFGPTTPKDGTPQDVIQRPTTMYGINKVAGELLCDYYHERFGLDTRGLRFPGLISHVTKPGGGTTDYAVEIYYAAVKHQSYTSYIAENTYMDMMYMPDALKAIVDLMEADPDKLKHRNAFNISAISAAPKDFAARFGNTSLNLQSIMRSIQCDSELLKVGQIQSTLRLRRKSGDRKSTRLNSSHLSISYAVFCLKKKNNNNACRNVHQQTPSCISIAA